MVSIYGVCCKLCDEFISLGQTQRGVHLSAFNLTPVEPILCPHCGSFYTYDEWELIDAHKAPLVGASLKAGTYPGRKIDISLSGSGFDPVCPKL